MTTGCVEQEQLALIDLDDTLIDISYGFDNPQLVECIASVQKKGVIVGLSSDTALGALELWHERLGMNGPIIAERGAHIKFDGLEYFDPADAELFRETREALLHELAEKKHRVWQGNPVEALRSSIIGGLCGENIALISDQRICSVGVFLRKFNTIGHLIPNPGLTVEVAKVIDNVLPQNKIFFKDIVPEHGIVIASNEDVTKRTGSIKLLGSMGLKKCVVIGNSISDFIGYDIADHYGVANASYEYKQHCKYVAKQPLSKGVSEILLSLT